jgi:16S rRNA G966 N2-methylase RsmD
MGLTFKAKWGDPIVELLKLLQDEQRQIKRHRKTCGRIQQGGEWMRKKREVKIQLTREETLRDVIHQIHIIRNRKRGRRADGRPSFKPTEDEKRLIRAQFFAMHTMSVSGQGKTENDRFCFVFMDGPYFAKLCEITKEQYEREGGDGSAITKWGPLVYPHD